MKQLILEIAKRNPEGFTIDLVSLKPVTSGYIASYLETQNSFGEAGLEKVINHAIDHDKVVGGWLDDETNLYYFDSSKVFENKEEAEKFGRENKQIAIFDMNELRTIRL